MTYWLLWCMEAHDFDRLGFIGRAWGLAPEVGVLGSWVQRSFGAEYGNFGRDATFSHRVLHGQNSFLGDYIGVLLCRSSPYWGTRVGSQKVGNMTVLQAQSLDKKELQRKSAPELYSNFLEPTVDRSSRTLAPQRVPKDLLFWILEPLRAKYLGNWGARVRSL